jgi:cell division inhibitor SepF
MGLMDKLFPPDPEDVVMNEQADDLSEAINAADPARVAPAVNNPNAPQYVLVRPSEFNDAISVADHVIAHKTVVLNLDNTGKEIARRILDVLSGAAYAVRAKIKNVSVGTYLIIPYGSEFSGEGMDTIETDSFKLE